MENAPRFSVTATQDLLRAKICEILQEVRHLISTQKSSFSVTEDKTEGRKTHRQAAPEGGCGEGLAK